MLSVPIPFLLWWVVATFGEGVAAADSPDAFGTADDWAILSHCTDEVFAASGYEPARRRQ